jgi:high-affinity nickel-transport protein
MSTASQAYNEDEVTSGSDYLALEGGGFLTRLCHKLFRVIDRPWKMYPLGVVFGLGFDTSSEVAILGITSVQALKGTDIWLILIFPILFTCKQSLSYVNLTWTNSLTTAGMCLLDTSDGALMMALYTSKAFSRDLVMILYYSITLTAITVIISAFIGIVQVLSLAQNIANPSGSFWDGVSAIGDNFDIIGGSVCALFLVIGLGSVALYKPWIRCIERRYQQSVTEESAEQVNEEQAISASHAQNSPPTPVEHTSVHMTRKTD